MDLFLQLLVNGISNGSHYALLSIGFGLIFGTTGIVHFAYGPIFAASTFMTWWLAAYLGLPFLVAVVGGVIATGLLGIASYVLLYEPFVARNSPGFVVLVASLGLSTIIGNLLSIIFGTEAKTMTDFASPIFFIGGVAISAVQVSQVLAFAIIAGLLAAFLKYSPYGNAIRAVSDNIDMARVVGIDIRKVSIVVFAIGSAISAVAAAHLLVKDAASTEIGFVAVFYAFIAVVVGGVGSIWGAALGGLFLGLIESLGMWNLPTEWQSTIAFVVLFAVLLWRPTGLFRGN